MISAAVLLDDQPLIPIERILGARDEIENATTEAAADSLIEVVGTDVDHYPSIFDQAIADGNIEFIQQRTQSDAIRFKNLIQPALFTLWSDAFFLGQQQGIEEMQVAVQPITATRKFDALVGDALAAAISELLDIAPKQLINVDAVQAVINRVNMLAGNFADDLFLELRGHLVAAIVPQADTGEPISRPKLVKKIQSTLNVGVNRARNIARTETTTAYARGGLEAFNRVDLVDYLKFVAIDDGRTTDICRTRSGMIVPKSDVLTIQANTAALHYFCRSGWSPVMSSLAAFQSDVSDLSRRIENRELTPLMDGWLS